MLFVSVHCSTYCSTQRAAYNCAISTTDLIANGCPCCTPYTAADRASKVELSAFTDAVVRANPKMMWWIFMVYGPLQSYAFPWYQILTSMLCDYVHNIWYLASYRYGRWSRERQILLQSHPTESCRSTAAFPETGRSRDKNSIMIFELYQRRWILFKNIKFKITTVRLSYQRNSTG